MKFKIYSILILVFLSFVNVQAQDYQISFTGSGAATTVASVRVENLTQGTHLEIGGTDVLHLVNTITGVELLNQNDEHHITFFPNPMVNYTRMSFNLPKDGNTSVYLYDISGRNICQVQDDLLKGQHTYRIQGIGDGLYVVVVRSGNFSASGKIISTSPQKGIAKMIYENYVLAQTKTENIENKEAFDIQKGNSSEVLMQYNTGDRLKLTGISGNYSTVIIDIPSTGKSITFNFVECKDGDDNNYPVVKIGTQTWIAENLKTTKYNDGTNIDNSIWPNPAAGAYCWYNNNSVNKDIYGALYNWHTIGTKKLCPIGWHVPTDNEWIVLTTYLGGRPIAGLRLKETGILHWASSYANNESGFTALPGGYRDQNGGFGSYRSNGFWWSATEMSDGYYSGSWYMADYSYQLFQFIDDKRRGLSVRCLKDN